MGKYRNYNSSNMRMATGEPIALETQFDLTVELLPGRSWVCGKPVKMVVFSRN